MHPPHSQVLQPEHYMNHLCCQICRKLLRNPVMIPCGHNFCMHCIQDQWDCDQLRNSLCRCPECKYEVLKRPRSCAETSESTLCGKHDKPLEVYCCTDEQIICAQCASAEHGGHRIGWVKEERSSNLQEEETEGSVSWKAFGELAQESIYAVLWHNTRPSST
uniref:RING-type domain-containing protein n=1 Tax=Neolamprologus brichardi TaxID=32507 RepID=A0A3Q4GIP7_NEOBR